MAHGKTARRGPSPDCNACAHYHVTWDERAPQGCRAFGFKSKRKPSVVVLENSGKVCGLFKAKLPRPER